MTLRDVFYHEKDEAICIVMEYLPHGITKLIKDASLSEEETKDGEAGDRTVAVIRQVIDGIVQMHSVGVFHRDLKTDNLLCGDDGQVKFVDFGIGKFHKKQGTHQHTKNVVTRCYRPPEVFFGDREYDLAAVDIWSAGCVFAELLTGKVLFPGMSDIEQLSLIFDLLGTPKCEEWPEVEDLPNYLPFCDQEPKDFAKVLAERRMANLGAKDVNPGVIRLIKRMVALNPAKRPTTLQLQDELSKI